MFEVWVESRVSTGRQLTTDCTPHAPGPGRTPIEHSEWSALGLFWLSLAAKTTQRIGSVANFHAPTPHLYTKIISNEPLNIRCIPFHATIDNFTNPAEHFTHEKENKSI